MLHSNFLDPEEGRVALGKSWEDPTDIGACLVECAQRLYRKGYLAATDGNVSLRISDEEIWITPTECVKAFARPDDMAVITLKNETEKGIASSERDLHLAIYRSCPRARAVVLAHPPTAIALSLAFPDWREIPPDLFPSVILDGGGIAVVPYGTPGSAKLNEHIAAQLATQIAAQTAASRLMILSRYGALAWGETLDEAYRGIERLEHCCKVVAQALQLGANRPLPKTEVETLWQTRKLRGERTI